MILKLQGTVERGTGEFYSIPIHNLNAEQRKFVENFASLMCDPEYDWYRARLEAGKAVITWTKGGGLNCAAQTETTCVAQTEGGGK